jgi:outer membrane receptor protein involved in Fe transport
LKPEESIGWDVGFEQPIANDRFRFGSTYFLSANLAANYALRDDVTVFARIDNLFNKQYEDPSGFLRPGLGVFGGIRLTAERHPLGRYDAPAPSPRSQGTM